MSSASCHAITKSQVIVAAAGRDTGMLSIPRVDKFKKPFPVASFLLSDAHMQDQVSATKSLRLPGLDSLLKALLAKMTPRKFL